MLIPGVDRFLEENQLMRIEASTDSRGLCISGKVIINHQYERNPAVTCRLNIKVKITNDYPASPPIFIEIGGEIPKSGEFHVNPDGSMCLGSPLRMRVELSRSDNFNDFYESFFIPYVYAALLKKKHGIDFVFGELSHGNKGEYEDYGQLFGVKDKQEVLDCLTALSLRRRVANKKPCPCGCGRRLGKCGLHTSINKYRQMQPRSKYAEMKGRLG